MIEREAELLRNQREPAQRVRSDPAHSLIEPTSILLDLARDDGAAVGGPQGLEPPGGARKGTDGEVPARVGGDQRAAVHHTAVSRRPRSDDGERDRQGDPNHSRRSSVARPVTPAEREKSERGATGE